ncbi:MAG: hypothetical protein DRJ67_06675 [Thermoprotei archaeon]|nr:MAG: hypothetical protein DRJ67_06675 [Thermoprotei archaeon]
MKVVEFKDVYKFFGNTVALDGVSFSMPQGLSLLLGSNGSGKSTAINIMAGLIRQDRGYVKVLGEDPRDVNREGRRVGFLIEKYWFYDFLTGYDHLMLAAKILGLSEPEIHVKKVLKVVQLSEYAHKAVGTYSKGTLQKLAIAHALLGDPELIVLDEPFANLDVETSASLMNLINELVREGRSVLVSTHVLSHFKELRAGHAVLLHKGKVMCEVELGNIMRVLEKTVVVRGEPLEAIYRALKLAGFRCFTVEDKVLVKVSHHEELQEIIKALKGIKVVDVRSGVLEIEDLLNLLVDEDEINSRGS